MESESCDHLLILLRAFLRFEIEKGGRAHEAAINTIVCPKVIDDCAYKSHLNLTSLPRITYNHPASQMGATGFDRSRNVRRDACRSVSVGTVIKSQGNTNANSNELALAA